MSRTAPLASTRSIGSDRVDGGLLFIGRGMDHFSSDFRITPLFTWKGRVARVRLFTYHTKRRAVPPRHGDRITCGPAPSTFELAYVCFIHICMRSEHVCIQFFVLCISSVVTGFPCSPKTTDNCPVLTKLLYRFGTRELGPV